MIKNINLNLAFDEIVKSKVRDYSVKELRATQTDVYASVYTLHKQCQKFLAHSKPLIVGIIENDKTNNTTSFISSSDELLLNTTNITPRLNTNLVRDIIPVQTYLKCIKPEQKSSNWHLCGSYGKINNFLVYDKRVSLIPKSHITNRGGKNDS